MYVHSEGGKQVLVPVRSNVEMDHIAKPEPKLVHNIYDVQELSNMNMDEDPLANNPSRNRYFYMNAHKTDCFYRFASSFVPGAGIVAREILESL